MKESIIVDKSKAFALRIIKLYRYLCAEKQEYVLSKQLLRSGTSIGANVREAKRAQSKPDFYSKMNIALKEADMASVNFPASISATASVYLPLAIRLFRISFKQFITTRCSKSSNAM